MGEVLGLGLTHYPPLSGRDEDMSWVLRWTLEDPSIPEVAKDPANWPAEASALWADDFGARAATDHRAAVLGGFSRLRAELDAFQPDVVLIWGDDQYENFKEDLIPPFAVLAYDDIVVRPWQQVAESGGMVGKPNYWDEPADTEFTIKGCPDVGAALTSALLESNFDVSYAYRPLHHPGLAHAFLNTILYLDHERRGFPYPVVAFPTNSYGRRVVSYRGIFSRLADERPFDPPSPVPARFYDLGAATARFFADSDWRVALVSSSSWSHAFLTDSTYRMFPDTEADRRLYELLRESDYPAWREVRLAEIERAGQQEVLNWWPLMGAMAELGRPVTWSEFVPGHIFNSNKVFAVYTPDATA